MKKIMILAAAVVALSGCVHHEVGRENPNDKPRQTTTKMPAGFPSFEEPRDTVSEPADSVSAGSGVEVGGHGAAEVAVG